MKTPAGRLILNILVALVTPESAPWLDRSLNRPSYRANYLNWAALGMLLDPLLNVGLISTPSHPQGTSAAVWISPLFWPDLDPLLLKRFQTTCDALRWQLVKKAREIIQLVFNGVVISSRDSAQSHLASLSNAIESFPAGNDIADPQMRSSQIPRYQTHRYECCRLTAVLMTRVVKLGKSWFDAASGTSYMDGIVFSFSNSNPGDLWEEHKGLLLWVAMIAHAVIHKTEDRPVINAVINRLIGDLAQGDHANIGWSSSKSLGEFLEQCMSEQLGNVRP